MKIRDIECRTNQGILNFSNFRLFLTQTELRFKRKLGGNKLFSLFAAKLWTISPLSVCQTPTLSKRKHILQPIFNKKALDPAQELHFAVFFCCITYTFKPFQRYFYQKVLIALNKNTLCKAYSFPLWIYVKTILILFNELSDQLFFFFF